MRKQQGIDASNRYSKLEQPDRDTSPGVNQDGLIAGFDQRGRAEAPGVRNWHPCPQQRHTKSRRHY
jgi:hypothetical protein